jgi:hypothetical protein
MRENRPSGSEGGEQRYCSPTPIGIRARLARLCLDPGLRLLVSGENGAENGLERGSVGDQRALSLARLNISSSRRRPRNEDPFQKTRGGRRIEFA